MIPTPPATHDDALRAAMAAVSQGRAADAERIARDVLARAGAHANASRIIGVALLAQHRPQDAIEPLQDSVRLQPDRTAETMLGAALRQSGRLQDAVARLEQTIAQPPLFPPALLELGLALIALRRYGEAEAALSRGREAASRMPEFSVALGDVYLAKSDRPRAKEAYAQALTLAPNHLGALHGLGTALLDGGDFAKAAEHYRRLVATGHASVQTGLNLGFCLLELGQWDDAIACLRSVVATDPRTLGKAMKMIVTSSRGRLLLKPSDMTRLLKPD